MFKSNSGKTVAVHQKKFISNIKKLLPFLLSYGYDRHTLNIVIRPEDLLVTMRVLSLHSSLQYKLLTTVTGVDYPDRIKRFEVIYELLSVRFNHRLRVRVLVNEVTPLISVASIFPAATWCEREIWDLFGVFFLENHEMKRILTDYGFEGHPLRKDFPLSGFVETRYNDKIKRIVSEPLEHAQQFRAFTFAAGWTPEA